MLKRFDMLYGIDLGTSNTVIYQQGKGIVLREPSVVAVRKDTGEIVAVGAEAQAMIGRTPGNIDIIYPLMDGVIANFDMTSSMLQLFIKKVQGRAPWFRSSQVYISVPCGITNVQKRAVEETVVHKGAKKAVAVEEPLAAALGAGLPVDEPIGSLVLDIGGGTSQVAVLSLGGIVVSHTVRRAGMSIDKDIIDYVKRTYSLAIGERTAEEIKKRIGSVLESSGEDGIDIRGRDLIDGLPRSLRLTSGEISSLMDDFLLTVLDAIRVTLERCPPELAGDVMDRGILLCGGGALLHGLDERIQKETGVPVHIADQPMDCTALGAGRMLDYLNGRLSKSSHMAVREVAATKVEEDTVRSDA
ncbi:MULTISPECIES: rod shape-determining protein [unclassified Paenibacillus]|uniref:rod shape-determining protein n=1 Tax=unclassified Paenibacillus TaxID=185978 RepID=UPI001AE885E9|nr:MULTISPECIES: rod shape-determining protein [unclassified Paenibacillus]MBP1155051.1 rod shape-determining protein MreB [Paenibacillus sp. PvP091]MBP1169566.1 rod shape-determining protein MreB [Paenibacillus sp. PvR098]MBP2440594.1 rod shape-determining protein MreB [Paenibacillus sp. PvP052]